MRRSCSIIGILLTSTLAILTGTAHASLKAGLPIRQVTVYPDRAAVTRDSTFNLEAGDHTILIENLPDGTLTESIRGSARGVAGITFHGLKFYIQRYQGLSPESTAVLQRRLSRLRDHDRKVQSDRSSAFADQKKLLSSLTGSAGQQMTTDLRVGNLRVADWDATLRFVGDRTMELNDSIRLTQDSLNRLDSLIAFLTAELEKAAAAQAKETFVVEVGLSMDQPGRVDVALAYVVDAATWNSFYEARLEEHGQVELSYSAQITQQTGEDWRQVDLTLSTARPSLGIGPDVTRPCYLALAEPQGRPVQTVDKLLKQLAGVQTDENGRVFIRGGRAGEMTYVDDGLPRNDPLGGLGQTGSHLALVPGAVVGTGSFVTTFRVPRQETILSGETEARVRLGAYHLDAVATLISRPKASPGAFRVLTITNQMDAPLMAGNCAIFDGPNYLGSTPLAEYVGPGQEFKLPFGLDNSVNVERKVLGYKRSQSGDKVKITQSVSIEVKNSGPSAATLDLEEPLPISRDSRATVILGKMVPPSDSTDLEGRTTWKLTVAPGQTTTVTIPYQIEFPAASVLSGF